MEYGMERSIPKAPRIITEPGTISQYSDRIGVRWEAPIDNRDPVQEFSVRYVPVERTIKGWVENGPAAEKTYVSWERNQYVELRELSPDTYYKIEIRVINKNGNSLPDTVVIKTRAAEFDASFTLQNIWGRLELDKRSMIQCFRDNSLKEVKEIRISRLLDTGQGWDLPRSSKQFVQGNPVFARILFLPSEDQLNRFGAFQCSFVKNETQNSIITLKLPPASLAELNALTPYVVASVGDDIELEVSIAKKRNQRIKWRRNDMPIFKWDNQLKVYLKNVQMTDSGIYECSYDGRREEGVHALMRLIVRSCPAELYGEFCQKECPPCYNGGVCHHEYGVCVCPAGFTGTNCEIACQGNRFGENCELTCHCEGGQENCDQDGYCHSGCDAGWTGLTCQTECTPGSFGYNCASICHCHENSTTPCDKIMGFCEGVCEAGYTGLDCQTRCPPNNFGVNCLGICNCYNGGHCNRFDGSCSCIGRWRGRYCNESEPHIIYASENIRAVFGEQMFLSCTATGIPEPLMDIFSSELPDLKVSVKLLQKYEYQAFVKVKLNSCGIFDIFCTARNQHGFDMKKITLSITECPPGRFGRNCASICHCYENAACDKVTGACEGDCEAGYMGFNCQKRCPPNSYGVNCRKKCLCANGGHCNRAHGTCACVGRWRGRYCKESKPQIVAVSNMIVKIGQEATISCTADGIPEPLIIIYDSKCDIMDVRVKSLKRHRYQAVGDVKPAKPGTFELLCTARNSKGSDQKNMTVTVIA
ncbi:uncharacterized protein LOC118191914 isoform X2 [Stegodyphus dumicola]|uniref:uncharacterized protein LOC118191914 isoform X2 n=1 Tax=Stegodyphus dumicola TaxID=202533 RepID=UPI0015AE00EC|nr:uncharacterized protein LOC118191914 isoform X2 [Stegodyphus dumicola]